MYILVNDTVGTFIDCIIESMQHPFWMLMFGLIFWFSIIWSINRNKKENKIENFWHEEKDEIIVALIGGLMFLIFDDEILQAYYDYTGKTGDVELKPYYYLLVAPAIDRLYWIVKKVRHGKSD